VVVVGGGPAGSRVAYRLAESGRRVVVLEDKPRLGTKISCTGIVSQECVDAFAISGVVILRKVNSARLFSPAGRLLRLWREETQACILDRAALDMAMAAQAQECGAEYALDCRASDITISGDSVTIAARKADKDLKITARAVVIASGFVSGLCEKLGLGRFADFAAGAQADVATAGMDEVEVYFGRKIAPGFFGWLVPTAPGRARVGLLSRRTPGLYLSKLLASLRAQGKLASSEAEPSYGGIPLKPLPRTYGERLLVVGDAAGQVKPTTGGGIYYGLLCADMAADTMHQALQDGDLSAGRLSGYERLWRRKLGKELRTGYWARRLFERLSDRQIDRIFEVVKANGIDEALLQARELSFDWHSRAVLSLVGYQVVSRAIGVMKIPFSGR